MILNGDYVTNVTLELVQILMFTGVALNAITIFVGISFILYLSECGGFKKTVCVFRHPLKFK